MKPYLLPLNQPHDHTTHAHTQIAEKRKARLAEAGGGISARLCRICKVKIDPQRHYCNDCAYKKVRVPSLVIWGEKGVGSGCGPLSAPLSVLSVSRRASLHRIDQARDT